MHRNDPEDVPQHLREALPEADVSDIHAHQCRAERFNSCADGLEDVKPGSCVFRKVFFFNSSDITSGCIELSL